jgi:predicted PhzF superfamily epimerase YddE/YHI9
MHLLRVFCSAGGLGGNPLAVFLDGGAIPAAERQRVAADLGLSETVFVDDAARGEIRIFTPAVELDFAGHPTVGTAWLLAEERSPVETLRPPAGDVRVRYDTGMACVAGHPDWHPRYEWEQFGSPREVDALEAPPGDHDMVGAWAWIDEDAGTVRSRVFPVALGIAEDEATGAAAIQMGHRLGRPLEIHQGRGSRIIARPLPDGFVEIGGLTVLDEQRDYG